MLLNFGDNAVARIWKYEFQSILNSSTISDFSIENISTSEIIDAKIILQVYTLFNLERYEFIFEFFCDNLNGKKITKIVKEKFCLIFCDYD